MFQHGVLQDENTHSVVSIVECVVFVSAVSGHMYMNAAAAFQSHSLSLDTLAVVINARSRHLTRRRVSPRAVGLYRIRVQ